MGSEMVLSECNVWLLIIVGLCFWQCVIDLSIFIPMLDKYNPYTFSTSADYFHLLVHVEVFDSNIFSRTLCWQAKRSYKVGYYLCRTDTCNPYSKERRIGMSMAESNNCQLSDTCIYHRISYNNSCRLVVHLLLSWFLILVFLQMAKYITEINKNKEE